MLRRTAIAALVAALLAPSAAVAGSLSIGSGPTTTGGGMPLFQAPLSRPGLIPADLTCTDGTPATGWRCGVPAGEDRWACWGPDGSEVPVTQGTGPTYENTPYGRAANIATEAAAPSISTANAGIFEQIWVQPHTLVVIGESGVAGKAGWYFSHGQAVVGGIDVQDTGTGLICRWNWAGGSVQAEITERRSALGVRFCEWTGSQFIARTNGSEQATTSAAVPLAPTGKSIWFGRYEATTGTRQINSRQIAMLIYNCPLSAESRARLESQVYGTRASDGRPITTTRAGPAWCDGGYQVGDNAPCVSAAGLESKGAVLSWAQNGARPDLWATFIGTPTITGPDADGWYTYTDDDVAAREVKRLGIIGAGSVTDGSYVVSCEMRPGTLTQAHTLISKTAGPGTITTGAGGDCSTWNITLDTARRYSCPINITGTDATTELTFVFEVGFDRLVATVGDIGIRQCQIEKSTAPGRRCDAGASPTTCPGDQHTVSTAGWPVASGWCEADVMLAGAPIPSSYIFDTRGPAAGSAGIGVYFGVAGSTLSGFTSPPVQTFTTPSLTWQAGSTYRIGLRWGGGRAQIVRDGVVVGTTDGASNPTSHSGTATIGSARPFSDRQPNGTIANLRCGRL